MCLGTTRSQESRQTYNFIFIRWGFKMLHIFDQEKAETPKLHKKLLLLQFQLSRNVLFVSASAD